MAAMTDYLENKIIDWLLRGQAYTPPATSYIGLLTAAPSDSAAGTEVTGGSYARVAVASNATNWNSSDGDNDAASSGTDGTTENDVVITFPAPTADWGSATHFGIYDASSGGNLLIHAALSTPKTINNGDAAPSFALGALSFQIDN